jgi:hypothetical protein
MGGLAPTFKPYASAESAHEFDGCVEGHQDPHTSRREGLNQFHGLSVTRSCLEGEISEYRRIDHES